nr:CRISPR-associated endonuclease Cas1 [uncultured Cohaesibacter sp.]
MAKIHPAPEKPHDGLRLFEQISSLEGLKAGWERVRDNAGASGGDGVSCDAFGIGSDMRLAELSTHLREGRYLPGPLRRVDIPKSSGGKRTLMIPCIRDRVAQSAAALRLSPLFEEEFEDVSYGYRPGRSVKQALYKVQSLREQGWHYAVDADIEAYFDNVSHDLMMQRLYRSVSESPLTELVSVWLETGGENGRGLAQGSPLSPLLANLFLDDLDEAFLKTRFRLVRYADDFVILTKSEKDAHQALASAAELLAEYGLRLNTRKTRVRGYDDSLKYLGAVFMRSMVMRDREELGFSSAESILREIAREDQKKVQARTNEALAEGALSSAGYSRGVRTLYLTKPDRELGVKNLAFAVRSQDPAEGRGAKERRPKSKPKLVATIHPTRLDRIEIGPKAEVETEALRNALSYGVEVAFVNGYGETLGTLAGPLPSRARRHIAQARHALDPDLRLETARFFVVARLKNQRALLRRLNQRRGLEQVDKVCSQFARPLHGASKVKNIQQMMGYEGEATANFWRGWSYLLLHGWSLPRRRRKPAPDPVNIALNIACHILERDIRTVLHAAGLHPGFGVLHSVDDGREALVYDFMEIFRSSLTESVVLEAFNTRMLRAEHFYEFDGHARISNAGYGAIIKAYEERAEGLVNSVSGDHRVTWRRLMLEQARDYAAYIEEGRSFSPYIINY